MENSKLQLKNKTEEGAIQPKSEEVSTKTLSSATASAYSKSVRMSSRKVLLVAEAVKKLSINDALNYLSVINKRSAGPILKTLQSAIANAKNANIDQDGLLIKSIEVSQAQALKRFHPSTRGRVHPYKKRASNIRVILEGKIKNV